MVLRCKSCAGALAIPPPRWPPRLVSYSPNLLPDFLLLPPRPSSSQITYFSSPFPSLPHISLLFLPLSQPFPHIISFFLVSSPCISLLFPFLHISLSFFLSSSSASYLSFLRPSVISFSSPLFLGLVFPFLHIFPSFFYLSLPLISRFLDHSYSTFLPSSLLGFSFPFFHI